MVGVRPGEGDLGRKIFVFCWFLLVFVGFVWFFDVVFKMMRMSLGEKEMVNLAPSLLEML